MYVRPFASRPCLVNPHKYTLALIPVFVASHLRREFLEPARDHVIVISFNKFEYDRSGRRRATVSVRIV